MLEFYYGIVRCSGTGQVKEVPSKLGLLVSLGEAGISWGRGLGCCGREHPGNVCRGMLALTGQVLEMLRDG